MRHLLTLGMLVANAAACALAVPLLILSLLLALNPEASPGILDLAGGSATLFLAYGAPLLLGLPLGFAAVRFFAARPLRIAWFHLQSAVWFLVVGIGAVAVLYAFNLALAGDILGRRARQRLTWTIVLIVLAWLAATATAVAAHWAGGRAAERRRRIAFLLLIASLPLSILGSVFPGAGGADGPPTAPEIERRRGTVFILAIEGATFAEILPMVSEGRLPGFSRLLKEGAHGSLKTVRPCRFATAWATLGTGKLPSRHAVKDQTVYRLAGMSDELRAVPAGLLFRSWLGSRGLESRDADGRDLRARPLWSILDLLRVEAVFLGWPLSETARPKGLETEAGERRLLAARWTRTILGEGGGGAGAESLVRRSVEVDLEGSAAFLRIAASSRPRVLAVYLPGLGSAGAWFPGRARPEEIEESGEGAGGADRVLDRYYEMLDRFLADAWAALPAEGHLLVVSAYGTEPLGAFSRLARRVAGLPAAAAGHGSGPAGIFMIAGPGVAAGKQVEDLHVADVVPLTLYLLGLPVGRDMDGRLPRRLFERPFLSANPITFIPGYR